MQVKIVNHTTLHNKTFRLFSKNTHKPQTVCIVWRENLNCFLLWDSIHSYCLVYTWIKTKSSTDHYDIGPWNSSPGECQVPRACRKPGWCAYWRMYCVLLVYDNDTAAVPIQVPGLRGPLGLLLDITFCYNLLMSSCARWCLELFSKEKMDVLNDWYEEHVA